MAFFTMKRKFTITALGHSIGFEPDVKKWVPPELHQEAMKYGAIPVDTDEDLGMPEMPVKPEIVTGDTREAALIKGCEFLRAKNRTSDFGANGLPKVKALQDASGIDDATAKERGEAWKTMMTTEANALNPSNANE